MNKKDSFKHNIQIEDYGSIISNPILLSSIRAGYNFCDKLKALDEDLEYSRRGSSSSPRFDKPIDVYDFKHRGEAFCTIYIYAYHFENIEEVPDAFIKLGEINENLDETWDGVEIVEDGEEDSDEILQSLMQDETKNPPSLGELFDSIVRNILTKHSKEFWDDKDEQWLRFQIQELEVSPVFEPLILKEWEDYNRRTHRPHRDFFVISFISSYHNCHLSPFLSKKIQEQNLEVEEAYTRLLKMINYLQLVAGEECWERIESEPEVGHGELSLLKQCTTKFCVLKLHTNFLGCNHIDFWLDAEMFEIFNIIPVKNMMRDIYTQNPGLEEQITCRGVTYDCFSWFKAMKEEVKYGDEHRSILANISY